MNNEYIVSGIVLGGIVIALFLIPAFAPDKNIFIIDETSNATDTTVCSSVGTGSDVVKSSFNGDCIFRTFVGSGDISVTNASNTIIIDFNGTSGGESTVCYNIGSQIVIIKNSTTGDCYVKSLQSGTGISITNGTNTITITNTLPEQGCSSAGGTTLLKTASTCVFKGLTTSQGITVTSNTNDNNLKTNFANGTGISITGATTQTFTNTSPESTTCTNTGTVGEGIYVSGNCNFKKLLAGTGITLSANGTRITLTNSSPESTACNNLGTSGRSFCSGGNLDFRKLITTNNVTLTITHNSTNVIIGNGAPESTVCTNLGTSGQGVYSTGNCNFKKLIDVGTGTNSAGSLTLTSNSTNVIFTHNTQGVLIYNYQLKTMTNIGTTYVDIYNTAFDSEELGWIECDGWREFDFIVLWDYIGTGTQQVRVVDANNNANVFATSGTFLVDQQPFVSGWANKPSFCTTGVIFLPEIQGKSTVAGDDPVMRGYVILVR